MLVALSDFRQSSRRTLRDSRSSSLGRRPSRERSRTARGHSARQLARALRAISEKARWNERLFNYRSGLSLGGGGGEELGEWPLHNRRSPLGSGEIARIFSNCRRRHLRRILRTEICSLE